MYLEFTYDLSPLTDLIAAKQEAIARGEWVAGPGAEFHRYFKMVTDEHFARLAMGGQWRGVTWDYFKEDSGGRKRPSGQRVVMGQSEILQDTRLMKRVAGEVFKPISPTSFHIDTNLNYAVYHDKGKGRMNRPFQFFTAEDRDFLGKFTAQWLEGVR